MKTASADEEPRWLTDEEQRTWVAYVHAKTLLEDHLDRQLQRDAGMPHLYYHLLVVLSDAPQRRLRQMADRRKPYRQCLNGLCEACTAKEPASRTMRRMSRPFHPRTALERAAHAAARRGARVAPVRSALGAVSMPGSRQRAALH